MMPVWEKLNYYKIEVGRAKTEREIIEKKLLVLVEPLPVVELTRANARAAVIEDVLAAWKLCGTGEELNLIVLDADEKKRFSKTNCCECFPKARLICRKN